MPFVFPPSSSLAAFLNKPLSLLCVAFLIEAAGLTPKAEFYGRERCSVGSTTIAAQSTVEFPGTVIWEVPHRTTPIQFFRELEKRLRVKHRIYITACHIRSAIHSKFRNLGDSIPIKQLTKGMSETGSLLDGVQLAETLGTAGVISHQVSVLWGTVKHIRQGSRGISLLHSSGRSNAPSDVQQAVSRLGMSVRNLSLYTPAGKGRFFFPTVEERASYKDSVDRENACSDACIGGRILDHITLPTKAAYSIALEERMGMPARRRPKKHKPNSDQPMKSSFPWKARELLMEEESPGCSVQWLGS
ncbi:hypothetical protein JRO89_XS08G0123200 [Xanthoceras sorbifolium]|uniref:Uncharacterized protein n=1 Tax=Xanthoceras sorbifolium TaxID=99658 RepID=A0ABQ8HPI0_9ROSI|nr:hypothetical protein JRO89_XS08G0123200 [Xanthoceras sorbifolium]